MAIRVGKKCQTSNTKRKDFRYSMIVPEISVHSLSNALSITNMLSSEFIRGQVSMSNPAVLNPTWPRGRVDEDEKTINVGTEDLFTAFERSSRFFGHLTNGHGHSFPEVLPFAHFPWISLICRRVLLYVLFILCGSIKLTESGVFLQQTLQKHEICRSTTRRPRRSIVLPYYMQ